jgi:hypothetical protein
VAPDGDTVTDRIALGLGLLLLTAIAADIVLNGGQAMLFLLVKFTDMIEWLAFWR